MVPPLFTQAFNMTPKPWHSNLAKEDLYMFKTIADLSCSVMWHWEFVVFSICAWRSRHVPAKTIVHSGWLLCCSKVVFYCKRRSNSHWASMSYFFSNNGFLYKSLKNPSSWTIWLTRWKNTDKKGTHLAMFVTNPGCSGKLMQEVTECKHGHYSASVNPPAIAREHASITYLCIQRWANKH